MYMRNVSADVAPVPKALAIIAVALCNLQSFVVGSCCCSAGGPPETHASHPNLFLCWQRLSCWLSSTRSVAFRTEISLRCG